MRLAILLLASSIALLPAASNPSFSNVSRAASETTSSTRSKPPKAAKAPKAAKFPKPAKVRSTRRSTAYCASCERDSHGRIVRSEPARTIFQRLNPCPATGKATGHCPGYVIDHIIPLKKGGPDKPWNMQWQTKAEAKAKDRIE